MIRLKRMLGHVRFVVITNMFYYSFTQSSGCLPKYVSEHVFSGHLTKYVRSRLCSRFVWSFMSNAETSFVLTYTRCAV